MKRYQLTHDAANDLQEIADYIATESPQAALRLVSQLEKSCESLALMPEAGRLREELAADLRSFPVGRYVIFYRIDQDDIQIIRVLHGSRDVADFFE